MVRTSSIVREQQADCYAGTVFRWVAEGNAPHFQLAIGPGLNQILATLFFIRDAAGTGFDAKGAPATRSTGSRRSSSASARGRPGAPGWTRRRRGGGSPNPPAARRRRWTRAAGTCGSTTGTPCTSDNERVEFTEPEQSSKRPALRSTATVSYLPQDPGSARVVPETDWLPYGVIAMGALAAAIGGVIFLVRLVTLVAGIGLLVSAARPGRRR